MLRNYYKIALRNFLRHKLFTFLNAVGLAMGLACSILIFIWVNDELGYDKFHKKSDKIFRITEKQNINDVTQHMAVTSGPLARALEIEIPEVEAAVRIRPGKKALLGYGEKSFLEENVIYTDPSFFKVFDFKLLKGSQNALLSAPNSIVLSEELAIKYFGCTEAVGKMINLNNRGSLLVTGVIENTQSQSHFQFNALVSMTTLNAPAWMQNWGVRGVYTYILLKSNATEIAFAKLPYIVEKYFGAEYKKIVKYEPQPITEIHLNSNLLSEIQPNSDINSVYIFIIIAIAILILACFNYANLSTAHSLSRLKEVGLRKTMGALKSQLVIQFLMEAFMLISIGLFIAIVLVETSLPFLNVFLGKHLHFLLSARPTFNLFLPILLFTVTLIAGLVPAVKLSFYKPAEAVANKIKRDGEGLRKGLAISQFVISTTLVIACVFVYQQFEYIQNRNLGFDKDMLVNIKGLELTPYKGKTEVVKQEFLRLPGIASGAASTLELGQEFDVSEVRLETESADNNIIFSASSIDHDYINTLQIPLIAGRNFKANSSDTSNAFIINETAVKMLGFATPDEALNRKLLYLSDGSSQTIIGVVRDFHIESLHQAIKPVLFLYSPKYSNKLTIKIKPGNLNERIASLETAWKRLGLGFPFEYSFADESLDNLYQKDKKMKQLLAVFSGLAVFIASLGLFGMATYTIEYKTKEIGIRKVLGASLQNLLILLARDFLLLILVALFIASPISWYLADMWLSNFAFRMEMNFAVFPITGILMMLVALITVSVLITKAALMNPVKSLSK